MTESGWPWRRLGWALVAALTLLAGYGISRLRIDDDLRSLIRGGSNDFTLVDEVAAVFGPPYQISQVVQHPKVIHLYILLILNRQRL